MVGETNRRTSDGRTVGKVDTPFGPGKTIARMHGPEFVTYHEQNRELLQHHHAWLEGGAYLDPDEATARLA